VARGTSERRRGQLGRVGDSIREELKEDRARDWEREGFGGSSWGELEVGALLEAAASSPSLMAGLADLGLSCGCIASSAPRNENNDS
jgi:hypothetical protein